MKKEFTLESFDIACGNVDTLLLFSFLLLLVTSCGQCPHHRPWLSHWTSSWENFSATGVMALKAHKWHSLRTMRPELRTLASGPMYLPKFVTEQGSMKYDWPDYVRVISNQILPLCQTTPWAFQGGQALMLVAEGIPPTVKKCQWRMKFQWHHLLGRWALHLLLVKNRLTVQQ
jgi:hypothetical protein